MATVNWRVFTPEQSAALDRIIDEMIARAEPPRLPTHEEQERRHPTNEMQLNWTAFEDHAFWTQQIGALNGRKVPQGVWYGHAHCNKRTLTLLDVPVRCRSRSLNGIQQTTRRSECNFCKTFALKHTV